MVDTSIKVNAGVHLRTGRVVIRPPIFAVGRFSGDRSVTVAYSRKHEMEVPAGRSAGLHRGISLDRISLVACRREHPLHYCRGSVVQWWRASFRTPALMEGAC